MLGWAEQLAALREESRQCDSTHGRSLTEHTEEMGFAIPCAPRVSLPHEAGASDGQEPDDVLSAKMLIQHSMYECLHRRLIFRDALAENAERWIHGCREETYE